MGAASKAEREAVGKTDAHLTVKDAAIVLGTSRHLVLKMAAKGELETAMVAKRLVITRASVERALQRA